MFNVMCLSALPTNVTTMTMTLNLIGFSFAIYSPQGFLYDKKAILEYVLHQKTEIARKMKVSIYLHCDIHSLAAGSSRCTIRQRSGCFSRF